MSDSITFASALVQCTEAQERCKRSGNTEWQDIWRARLKALCALLPSGSGIDSGTEIMGVTGGLIVLTCSFHHMTEDGVYDGYTDHTIKVTPRFDGISISISGKDRNEIKEYLGETYHNVLSALVHWDDASARWEVQS